jgi:hypothetical protein
VAVRIAADQDHGTRPMPPGAPRCPPPYGHTLRNNHFADNGQDTDIAEGA